jgi:DNA-binding transcriptional MerR regulator
LLEKVVAVVPSSNFDYHHDKSLVDDLTGNEIESLNPKKNKSGQRLYQKRDVELIFDIKQLLYAEKFTVAGARKKLKQNKKKETQLDIAFDREGFVEWKEEIKQDLESILSTLDNK